MVLPGKRPPEIVNLPPVINELISKLVVCLDIICMDVKEVSFAQVFAGQTTTVYVIIS